MNKKDLFYKKILENNGTITTESALDNGIYKDLLKELIVKEEIVRIAGGLYGLPNEEIDEYLYFTHRVPNGVFSHETAAYLHGLTTRMPLYYVMSVKTGDNVSRITKIKDNIVFKYNKSDFQSIGKTIIKNPFGREVPVFDKERTILDFIKDKNRIDSQVFSETLKSYFESNDQNLLKLTQYAVKMNLEKQLKLYTEVLL